MARLRYIAVPLALLVVGLRHWRPLPPALVVVGLALAWNVTPLAAGLVTYEFDLTARATVWRGPLAYLHSHLRPGYRDEAVDTIEHWPAFYLAESGIPLVRGWFRQDDFPFNSLLYRKLKPVPYQRWLRELGVAYVVVIAPRPTTARGKKRHWCAVEGLGSGVSGPRQKSRSMPCRGHDP